MKAKRLFQWILLGCLVLFSACSPSEPQTFSSFDGREFTDELTSLDEGQGDSLLLGTDNGKLIFYDTRNSKTDFVNVGSGKVYFARQDTLDSTPVTFVGVRNEGIKMYCNSDLRWRKSDTAKHSSFSLRGKGNNYSVYKVERFGDYLLCATSNGLCQLNLKNRQNDSLQLLFPRTDSAPKDYQIKSMQLTTGKTNRLFISHGDSLFVFRLEEDGHIQLIDSAKRSGTIANLCMPENSTFPIVIQDNMVYFNEDRDSCKNSFKIHSCIYNPSAKLYMLTAKDRFLMGPGLSPDMLGNYRLTLSKEHYTPTANMIVKNGGTYVISGATLCRIPDHLSKGQGKQVTAICQSGDTLVAVSDLNRVYIPNRDRTKWWQRFSIQGNVKDNVSKCLIAQNTLCVLSGGDLFFQVNKRGCHSLRMEKSAFKNEDITRVYYNAEDNRIFFAWRSGYAYGSMQDGGLPDANIVTDTLISVQCFAQKTHSPDTLYIGTLNDGCYVKNLRNNTFGPTLFKGRLNITDLSLTENGVFALSPVFLYKAEPNSREVSDSVSVRDLHVCRIYPCKNSSMEDCLLGVSKLGGLYIFQQDSLAAFERMYPDILFYPDAINIEHDTLLTAGTNIGLLEINLKDGKSIHRSTKLNDPWLELKENLQEHMQAVVSIGIPVACFLIILIAILLYWSMNRAKRISQLNKENRVLDEKQAQLEENVLQLKKEKENLTAEKDLLGTNVLQLSAENDVLATEKNQLEKEARELTEENSALAKKKAELEKNVIELTGERIILMEDKRQLGEEVLKWTKETEALTEERNLLKAETKNLHAEKKDLEKKRNELKENVDKFRNSHENAKASVLGGVLFKSQWSIGNDWLNPRISHYKEYDDYMEKKKALEDEIEKIDSLSCDFHEKLERGMLSVREVLFTPALHLEAYALREWCALHYEELMKRDAQTVSLFREQIATIINTYLESAIRFTDQRDRETQKVFLRIWASALILQTPEFSGKEEFKPLQKAGFEKEQQRTEHKVVKLSKPQCMYHLLIDKKDFFISEDNFNKKKSIMKTDFNLYNSDKEKHQNKQYAFECDNEFLTQVLIKLFKME